MQNLLLVLEGYGDVRAAPVLVRRILRERLQIYDCRIETHRRHGLEYLRANDWERLRRYTAVGYYENAPVLWLLDCDDDCARDAAREMTQKIISCCPQQPVAVALLPREYETMFLIDIEATKQTFSLYPSVIGPTNPKGIRDAKGRISRLLPRGRAYKETVDQPKITARLSFDTLEASYSDFRHLLRAIQWLAEQSQPGVYPTTFPS